MATYPQTVSVEVQNGSRVVRIPEEFGPVAERLNISQDSVGRLILEPALVQEHSPKSLEELMRSWGPLPEDESFPEITDAPPEPVDL